MGTTKGGMIEIANDGPEIVTTNYWSTEHARKGYVYLSTNAGCLRLLVPEGSLPWLEDMRSAREVIVSRGPWPDADKDDAVELLFDDGTDEPFALHLSLEQADRLPLATDVDTPGTPPRWRFAAWTDQGKELEFPARYRIVSKIPWLKEF